MWDQARDKLAVVGDCPEQKIGQLDPVHALAVDPDDLGDSKSAEPVIDPSRDLFLEPNTGADAVFVRDHRENLGLAATAQEQLPR